MPELPDELKREVWKRDGYRCQQCGVAVASQRGLGCKPQTHHRNPKGDDSLENLITLCWTCHATKNSPGHRSLLLNATEDEWTSHIKSSFWQVSTDLLVYAENLSAFDLPAGQVLEKIQQFRGWLDYLEAMTLEAVKTNPDLAYNRADIPDLEGEDLNPILRGLSIACWSRIRRSIFDDELLNG